MAENQEEAGAFVWGFLGGRERDPGELEKKGAGRRKGEASEKREEAKQRWRFCEIQIFLLEGASG